MAHHSAGIAQDLQRAAGHHADSEAYQERQESRSLGGEAEHRQAEQRGRQHQIAKDGKINITGVGERATSRKCTELHHRRVSWYPEHGSPKAKEQSRSQNAVMSRGAKGDAVANEQSTACGYSVNGQEGKVEPPSSMFTDNQSISCSDNGRKEDPRRSSERTFAGPGLDTLENCATVLPSWSSYVVSSQSQEAVGRGEGIEVRWTEFSFSTLVCAMRSALCAR